jgi:RimJ/RimL family protein N-acetyltransferase
MPWTESEPQTLDEKVELLRGFRGRFDLGEDFVYAILDRAETEVVGGTGLHTRVGPEGLEIGYWVRASRIGAGLASEATAALTRAAFEVCGVDRVEIRVDPANERSARIPLRLGFRKEATLRRRLPLHSGGTELRDATVFALFADDFPSSPAASVAIAAWDAAGRQLL